MGTYDTRGGTPQSPDVPEPYISPEQEELLDVLESAGVPSDVSDRVTAIVSKIEHRLWEAENALTVIEERRAALVAQEAEK